MKYINTDAFDACPMASSLASTFRLIGAVLLVWADWRILAGLICLGIWKKINRSVEAIVANKKKRSGAYVHIPDKNEIKGWK